MSFKKNNKGFTLVELIIVIAIIAILAVVVAPQYLKYVEQSRVAVDENALNEIAHAAEIAAIGDGVTVVGDGSFKIVIASGTAGAYTAVAVGSETNNVLPGKVEEIIKHDSYTFKSSTYKAATVTFTVTGGVASWVKS